MQVNTIFPTQPFVVAAALGVRFYFLEYPIRYGKETIHAYRPTKSVIR